MFDNSRVNGYGRSSISGRGDIGGRGGVFGRGCVDEFGIIFGIIDSRGHVLSLVDGFDFVFSRGLVFSRSYVDGFSYVKSNQGRQECDNKKNSKNLISEDGENSLI
ncbi:hypothetical protein RCL_jg6048.t1 [Rhizophagus clarus]|uniref:Uncharacterized protein n=1 Tax=Rhizophagus clarus TaxID=94130 RepID=A0A8H3L527_9GLOM|nr:hypothetical protein RCL_jg6048.t1 [Rhizophagus clarus]